MVGLLPILRAVVDTALPPRCPTCSMIVSDDHRLCAGCWSDLRFLAQPCCALCRLPFAFDRGVTAQCAQCLARPPVHDGIHAAVAYGETARQLALRLKYGRRTAHADTAARLMRSSLPNDIDLIVPVPLHRWRMWTRGFNQAALIASAIGSEQGVRVKNDLLVRTRATPSLRGLSGSARIRAVAGAFAVRKGADDISGRTVALVDDVYASGATTNACVEALKRAGAVRVPILVWARVLPDDGD